MSLADRIKKLEAKIKRDSKTINKSDRSRASLLKQWKLRTARNQLKNMKKRFDKLSPSIPPSEQSISEKSQKAVESARSKVRSISQLKANQEKKGKVLPSTLKSLASAQKRLDKALSSYAGEEELIPERFRSDFFHPVETGQKRQAKVVPKKVRGRSPGDPFRDDKIVRGRSPGDPFRKDKQVGPVPTRRGDERITINPKDTLSDLAKDRGTTLAAIRRANPGRFPTAKSLNIIKAGEKINMPPNVGATTPYDTKTVRVKPKVVPTPKRKPTRQTKTESEDSTDVREQYPTKGTRRELKPLEGGVRYIETPFGRIKMDTSDKAFNYDNPDNVTHGKRGGQVKKGVKKIKAKARRRAALRGHRAELRGG